MNIKIKYFFTFIILFHSTSIFSQIDSIEKAESLYGLGKIQADDDSAIRYFDEAIQYNSKSSKYFYQRGIRFFKKRDYKNAFSDFSKAINISEQIIYLFNRAMVCMNLLQIDPTNIPIAKTARNDLIKVKNGNPKYKKDIVIKALDRLNTILEDSGGTEKKSIDLGNGLHHFGLKNSKSLYIQFPFNLPSTARFNIINQNPNKKGKGSSTFLLELGTHQQFIDTLISCIDIVERDNNLFIMTIDDPPAQRVGLQHDLTYGSNIDNMIGLSDYKTWVRDVEVPIKGWLKFSEDGELYNDNNNLIEEDEYIQKEGPDLVEHNGRLVLKVLKDNKIVKMIESVVECGIPTWHEKFDATDEKIVEIHKDCPSTKINVRIILPQSIRWLLDRSKEPQIMSDYILVINGKEFPNDKKYIEYSESEDGEKKYIDFRVRLKRKSD